MQIIKRSLILFLIISLSINCENPNEEAFIKTFFNELSPFNDLFTNIEDIKIKQIKFLDEDDMLDFADDFVEGVLLGIGNNQKTNECYKSLGAENRTKLKIAMYDISKAIYLKKDFYLTFIQIFQELLSIDNTSKCKLSDLYTELYDITTVNGRINIAQRMQKKSDALDSLVKLAVKSYNNHEYGKFGKCIGLIISIALDYTFN